MTFRRHLARLVVTVFAVLTVSASAARAVFHLAVVDEVMTAYGGDPNFEFVEIRMLGGGQNQVMNTVLAFFDSSGTHMGDVLVVPGNVTNSGANVRWLMASGAFATAHPGVADFVWSGTNVFSETGGMVCWGAPGSFPPPPMMWDHTVANNYTDCLAYGDYSGPPNNHTSAPTTLTGDGYGMVRLSDTDNNAPPGVTKVILKAGSGNAKILVKGKEAGAFLPTLPLSATTDVRVQVLNSATADCWEATFPAANVSEDSEKLKAKVP